MNDYDPEFDGIIENLTAKQLRETAKELERRAREIERADKRKLSVRLPADRQRWNN